MPRIPIKSTSASSGFTLVELIVVIMIMSLVMLLVGIRSGTFDYWKEEAFLRKLNETIIFLHHQAVTDQSFYRLQFDLKKNTYKVGVLRIEDDSDNIAISSLGSEVGSLTLELTAFLNPDPNGLGTLIPPPAFPSLAEPQLFPENITIKDIRTMRGRELSSESESAYILFSPRGFSEFAVIHLQVTNGAPITILVNPFTGLTNVYREYRDFEWTYGRKKDTAA